MMVKVFMFLCHQNFIMVHDDYKGFRISKVRNLKEKLLNWMPMDMKLGRPIDFSITKTIAEVIISVILLVIDI